MKKIVALMCVWVLSSGVGAFAQSVTVSHDEGSGVTVYIQIIMGESTQGTGTSQGHTPASQLPAALEEAAHRAAQEQKSLNDEPNNTTLPATPKYSAKAREVLKRYHELIKNEAQVHALSYYEQSYDNTITPFVQELMEAHNKLKAANPKEALRVAEVIVAGKFDIPAFIDRFSYGWDDCAEQDAYAAYLRSVRK